MVKRDFKGYVFLTTSYSKRVPLLIATIAGVMEKVKNATFVVQWCEDSPSEYVQFVLGMIAKSTGNLLVVNTIGSDMSVAYSKFISLAADDTHFINLDDDLLVSKDALDILHGLANTPIVTIGVTDGCNARGFADYDETVYPSYLDFCLVHEPGKAKHHRFKYFSVRHGYKWISQFYCLRRDVYEADSTWREVKQKFLQKGVRGYDIMLEKVLADSGVDIALIMGCEALHIGLEHPYIGGPWTSANEIASTVVHLKDA